MKRFRFGRAPYPPLAHASAFSESRVARMPSSENPLCARFIKLAVIGGGSGRCEVAVPSDFGARS